VESVQQWSFEDSIGISAISDSSRAPHSCSLGSGPWEGAQHLIKVRTWSRTE